MEHDDIESQQENTPNSQQSAEQTREEHPRNRQKPPPICFVTRLKKCYKQYCLKWHAESTLQPQNCKISPITGAMMNTTMRASAIKSVICLPPDNTADDSDYQAIDEDKISTNITCDESPLDEIAGTIEVIYTSTIEDYGGPGVQQEELQPSTSEELHKHKYRPVADFKPVWKKTKRTAYDIHPVHEPLIKEKQEPLLRTISEKTPFELFNLFFNDEIISLLVDPI
ncbi:hypothetical protein QE152_g29089 [Popillia japonica]|uniref:Uncharacterized protein n=1 Tax=Popillia japonica TaxID=7064 RepID=A0AAW1JIS2_POPJA